MVVAGSSGATLAFDIGTKLGWSLIGTGDRVLFSGALRLSPKEGDHEGLRCLTLARWLEAPTRPWAPSGGHTVGLVGIEDVLSHTRRDKATGQEFIGTTAAHVYGALRGVVAAWACARGIPVQGVNVATWKSGIGLGGPGASKDEIAARLRLLGYTFSSQDECDAIGIGLCAHRRAVRTALAVGLGPEVVTALRKARRKRKPGFF